MAKGVKVFAPTATLRTLKVGEEITIPVRDCKPSTIRRTAVRLKPMEYVVSEKDRKKDTYVKRII